jgi:hypothetical protein
LGIRHALSTFVGYTDGAPPEKGRKKPITDRLERYGNFVSA